MRLVESPSFLVMNKPWMWAQLSAIPDLWAVDTCPQAVSASRLRSHGRLYFFARPVRVSTTSASFPSPSKNFGVSRSLITVTRAILMSRTSAPQPYQTYLQPLLLSYVQVSGRSVLQAYLGFENKGQAKAAGKRGAKPHQAASVVISHCLLAGRYSRKTVVSSTRFPPEPKAANETNSPRTIQLGEAPAQMAKIALMNKETLNANLRPMMSAVPP